MFHLFPIYNIEVTFSWLETLAKFAEIFTAFSFGLAIYEYRNKKQKDKITAVADQISFFNEKVIPSDDKFQREVTLSKTGQDYKIKKVIIDVPNFKRLVEQFPDETLEQFILANSNDQIYRAQLITLNYMEELAIRIFNYDTLEHESLNSIKHAYVHLVEMNATMLLIQNDLVTDGEVYKDVIKLYFHWKDKIDRTPLEEKIKSMFVKKN